MPGRASRIYWDANCFLSYINADEDRLPVLEALLVQSAQRAIRIVTSTLSIVEVAYGAREQRHGLSAEVEGRIDALWQDNSTVELVEFYDQIAYRAREIIRRGLDKEWRLTTADAVHLASAERIGAEELHTYDSRLHRYSEIIGRPVVEPHVQQGRLL